MSSSIHLNPGQACVQHNDLAQATARISRSGQAVDSEAHHPSGKRAHVLNPPAATRLAYGHYPDREEAKKVLATIEQDMTNNIPIRIAHDDSSGTIFSIPPDSVYYVVLGKAGR